MHSAVPLVAHNVKLSLMRSLAKSIPSSLCESFNDIKARPCFGNEFAAAILGVKEKIILCNICANISEGEECAICSDLQRDQTRICVVEEPLDVIAIERANVYSGQYHILHGIISPVNGIGPKDLKLRELILRLQNGNVEEIIIATSPNLEGDATAMYIQKLIGPSGISITRLARGLPSGSDIEYADDSTLAHALESRTEIPQSSSDQSG